MRYRLQAAICTTYVRHYVAASHYMQRMMLRQLTHTHTRLSQHAQRAIADQHADMLLCCLRCTPPPELSADCAGQPRRSGPAACGPYVRTGGPGRPESRPITGAPRTVTRERGIWPNTWLKIR